MRAVFVFALLAVGLSLVPTAPAALPPSSSARQQSGICVPREGVAPRGDAVAFAAAARHTLTVHGRPDGKRGRVFGRLNQNHVPTIFGVVSATSGRACDPLWYKVQLPIRPNGAIGFVRADDVEVYPLRTRIEIDLSKRRIEFFRGERRVLTVTSAVGASSTPTPTGRFYVNQRLLAGDSSGPFGPGAIGISAFSPVLTGWVQGGPIAIHGTNRPDSIGHAVTNGCLRIPNAVLRRLFKATPNGTPVTIRA